MNAFHTEVACASCQAHIGPSEQIKGADFTDFKLAMTLNDQIKLEIIFRIPPKVCLKLN